MLTAGIAVLTGVVVACYLPQRIDTLWLSFLPACLYFAYYSLRWRLAWLFLCSFLWAGLHIHWHLEHRLSSQLNNKRLTVLGEVINIPNKDPTRARFLFKPEKIENYTGKLPRIVRLNWRQAPPTLSAGQQWNLRIKIKRPWGFQNPGGFDYQRWLFSKGIDATGYVITSGQNQLVNTKSSSINRIRQSILSLLASSCVDCNYIGLIEALSIGYRGNISVQQRALLQQTGTAHLIAISGLHIGIIAGIFYFIGLKSWRWAFAFIPLTRMEFALLLSWTGGLAYSLLSGFDLPAQRVMIMLSVVLMSSFLRIPFNLLHSITLAMMLVLLWSPLSVLSASFWLTFSALLVICVGIFILRDVKSRIYKAIVIQVLFSFLFIPLSMIIFGQIHLASLFANLVAVPLVSLVIVPLNFLLLSLNGLPSTWLEPGYQVLDVMVGILVTYLDKLQAIGLQAYQVPAVSAWKVIILLIFLLIWLLPRGLIPHRRISPLLLIILIWPRSLLDHGEMKVAVLDVGMGTSVVVNTRYHSLIYDFGAGNRNGFSLGKWVVEPFLQYQGARYIDQVVISHADQDHAGGFYAIENSLDYGPIFSGTPEEVARRLTHAPLIQDCHLQPAWYWDGVRFEFISEGIRAKDSKNNRSCVLKISTAGKSVLISGDIEQSREHKLIKLAGSELRADILIAPHHGSLTSSSVEFIRQVAATDIIFQVGYLNRWGFPRQAVLKRYQQTKAAIHRTDRDGAILIHCKKQSCQLEKFRRQHPRVWY